MFWDKKKGRPANKPYEKVHINLDKSLRDKAQNLKKERFSTLTAVVNQALKEYLEKQTD